MIFKGTAKQHGVAIEVPVAANLGPGGIDAERDDRQQDIDDPDTEIFAGAAGEGKALESRSAERPKLPWPTFCAGNGSTKAMISPLPNGLSRLRQEGAL
ncbi:hypothetical protein [Ensifer aridi]|uniref:hypothetical protein n=1 Tax=Ensifer aridi TaxID=1708715 RepID=UPI00047E0A87|nr:hypothetical protein [Ensifer aridi]